jgi:excisionase family DNA binding protein
MDKTKETLIDARALAQNLGVTVSAIRFWTRTTELPRIRCGRLVRFRYSDVVEWLERDRSVASTSPG